MKRASGSWNEVQQKVISTNQQSGESDSCNSTIDAQIEIVGIVAFLLYRSRP